MADKNAPPAKDLTAEELKIIEKLETPNKLMKSALLEAEVWNKNSDQLKLFNNVEPKSLIEIAIFDEAAGKFKDGPPKIITGAEYRHAFVMLAAYSNKQKLDEDGLKLMNMQLFGQETTPDPGDSKDPKFRAQQTAAFRAGIAKIREYGLTVAGEFGARPVAPKKEGPMEEKQSSLQPDMKSALAAIGNMEAALDEMAKVDGKGMAPNMAKALLVHSETQLSDALKGKRSDPLGIPFKTVSNIGATKAGLGG